MNPFDFLVAQTGVLTISPFWALAPAVLAASLYAWFRTPLLIAATAIWSAYIPFELGMRAELFCLGKCLPRADLLPVFGLLAATSLLAFGEALFLALYDLWRYIPKRHGNRGTAKQPNTMPHAPNTREATAQLIAEEE